jgi:hypothetical protein
MIENVDDTFFKPVVHNNIVGRFLTRSCADPQRMSLPTLVYLVVAILHPTKKCDLSCGDLLFLVRAIGGDELSKHLCLRSSFLVIGVCETVKLFLDMCACIAAIQSPLHYNHCKQSMPLDPTLFLNSTLPTTNLYL